MKRIALLTFVCVIAAFGAGAASASVGPLRVTEAQMGQMVKNSRLMPMVVLRADCHGLGRSIGRRYSTFQCDVDSPRRHGSTWFVEMNKAGWIPSLLDSF